MTEFGYLTTGFRAQEPKVRAAWLASAFTLARRNPRVKPAPAVPARRSARRRDLDSGILAHDGSPQPTYARLARASASRR